MRPRSFVSYLRKHYPQPRRGHWPKHKDDMPSAIVGVAQAIGALGRSGGFPVHSRSHADWRAAVARFQSRLDDDDDGGCLSDPFPWLHRSLHAFDVLWNDWQKSIATRKGYTENVRFTLA